MIEVLMPFDGNRVEVIKDEEGNAWVSVRSVCRAIGIDIENQRKKIEKDSRYRFGHITAPSAGGNQVVLCIPLNQINGWLFSINPNKVPEHIRQNLIAYQQECFAVLYNHFMPRGEVDLERFMERFDRLEQKIDGLSGIADTVFGNDKNEITNLIESCAKAYKVDGRTVWGWVQTNCDVGSYKRQNNRIKNYLKNLLGEGLKLISN